MRKRGLKVAPWTKAAGIRESTLRGYLSNRSNSMTLSTVRKLAETANVSLPELLGEYPRETKISRDATAIRQLAISVEDHGIEAGPDMARPPLHLPRALLADLADDVVGHLLAITVPDDSMRPTLREGDTALVNSTDNIPLNDHGIFCFWSGRSTMVKRLQILPSPTTQYRVLSDDKEHYPPYPVDAEAIFIIGRVVWRAGKI